MAHLVQLSVSTRQSRGNSGDGAIIWRKDKRGAMKVETTRKTGKDYGGRTVTSSSCSI